MTAQQSVKVQRPVANGLPRAKAIALIHKRESRLRTGVRSTMNLRTGHWILPDKE